MTSRWVTILLASYTSEPVDKHVPPAGSVQKMTKEQLSCEKTVLQKNLLHYEGLHGRPVSCLLPQLFSGFRRIYLFMFKFYFLLGFFVFLFQSGDQRRASGGEAPLRSLQTGQTNADKS